YLHTFLSSYAQKAHRRRKNIQNPLQSAVACICDRETAGPGFVGRALADRIDRLVAAGLQAFSAMPERVDATDKERIHFGRIGRRPCERDDLEQRHRLDSQAERPACIDGFRERGFRADRDYSAHGTAEKSGRVAGPAAARSSRASSSTGACSPDAKAVLRSSRSAPSGENSTARKLISLPEILV